MLKKGRAVHAGEFFTPEKLVYPPAPPLPPGKPKRDCGMGSFALAHRGEVFRYLTYKRLFTPYEQDEKFMDESQFEDIHYSFGVLVEAADLGGGDWLLGFREVIDGYSEEYGEDTLEETGLTVFRRLSEIQLYQFDGDPVHIVPYDPHKEKDDDE